MEKVLLPMSLFIFILVGCNSQGAQYGEDLQTVADEMLDNATKTEAILEQYAVVWDHSIKSKGAIPVAEMTALTGFEQSDVEEYFEINTAGNIPEDFSTNIHSLNAYYEDSGELEGIRNAADSIKSKMAELNDPPDEFEKAYDEVLNMYNYTEEYIEMALDPSGSLQSFNENKNQLASDIISVYKRIEVIMPSED
ncbi:hypothetical protein KM908_20520 [Alkalihalobacillus clausii]|jgi:hypothetical protein|uniref:hypothetical protein n=1 Tax=Shouchella clausii TaxID=79880 RepID=UPI001C23106E|nr:hypothetical protein [Shouchella clausii]MBU8598500.1 hypothetical protein [Shouchella clausii]